jgi:small-conductance mechanosensitive channel
VPGCPLPDCPDCKVLTKPITNAGATALIDTILGGAGVVGLAIGFEVRDSLENYISSIMLSLRQPFRANDHIVIGEHEGKVVRLTSRATVLMTLDGNHLRIPDSQLFKAVILNYTSNPERRFDFELGVGADDDPVVAMKIGLEALCQLPFVDPFCFRMAFGWDLHL